MTRFGIDRLHRCAPFMALTLIAQAAHGQEAPNTAAPLAGEYVHSEMEMVAGIRLNEDGTFLYGLTVGSLDERAQGRWKAAGNHIELISDPKPVAPTITAGAVETGTGAPFALRVRTPKGNDVQGVDIRIEFDDGDSLESYTVGEPWSLPADERRIPRFVTFEMPSYRLRSERMPVEAVRGSIANFILTPNDFGVVDLTGADLAMDGQMLTLRRQEGVMQFKRVERRSEDNVGN